MGAVGCRVTKVPGFGKDAEKNRAEAKRPLVEAGYPNGLKVVLENRNVRVPYNDLFLRQSRALDHAERKKAINEIERMVLGHAYYIPGIWWARSVVHWAKVKNYIAPPNHYSNQKLQDVWLSED